MVSKEEDVELLLSAILNGDNTPKQANTEQLTLPEKERGKWGSRQRYN